MPVRGRLLTLERCQQTVQLTCVEQAFRRIACQRTLDFRHKRLSCQPCAHWHGETELLAIRNVVRQNACRRRTKRQLIPLIGGLETRRHGARNLEHAQIAERHANIKARATRDLRGVIQNAAFKIRTQVGVELLPQFIVDSTRRRTLLDKFLCGTVRKILRGKTLLLFRIHDVRGAVIDRLEQLAQRRRVTIHAVAREELIGTFARKTQLGLAARHNLLACRIQRERGNIGRGQLESTQKLINVSQELFGRYRKPFEIAT